MRNTSTFVFIIFLLVSNHTLYRSFGAEQEKKPKTPLEVSETKNQAVPLKAENISIPTSDSEEAPSQFHFGAVGTAIGLPAVFRLGPEFRFGDSWGLAIEYGFIPSINWLIKFEMYSFRVTPKVYPFQGDFFLGLAGGLQKFRFESFSILFGTDVRQLDTVFLTPHLGWRWGSKKGGGKTFIGMEFGLQIALSTNATYTSGASEAIQATDAYITYKASVEKEGALVGSTTVAHFALVQYGFMF